MLDRLAVDEVVAGELAASPAGVLLVGMTDGCIVALASAENPLVYYTRGMVHKGHYATLFNALHERTEVNLLLQGVPQDFNGLLPRYGCGYSQYSIP